MHVDTFQLQLWFPEQSPQCKDCCGSCWETYTYLLGSPLHKVLLWVLETNLFWVSLILVSLRWANDCDFPTIQTGLVMLWNPGDPKRPGGSKRPPGGFGGNSALAERDLDNWELNPMAGPILAAYHPRTCREIRRHPWERWVPPKFGAYEPYFVAWSGTFLPPKMGLAQIWIPQMC